MTESSFTEGYRQRSNENRGEALYHRWTGGVQSNNRDYPLWAEILSTAIQKQEGE